MGKEYRVGDDFNDHEQSEQEIIKHFNNDMKTDYWKKLKRQLFDNDMKTDYWKKLKRQFFDTAKTEYTKEELEKMKEQIVECSQSSDENKRSIR